MRKYSTVLWRFAALFGLIGAFLGSHMAGSGSYEFRTLHAHILVVGWLSLFAWAVFYKIFTPVKNMIAVLHVYSAIIGVFGLTIGMWLYYVKPFDIAGAFPTIFFIVGGTILLISFFLFFILTFMKMEKDQ